MTSKQWKHPGSPPPKKFKIVHSALKAMASIFWDSQGVIMIDYLEQARTINGAYFAGKLRRLRQEIAKKEARETGSSSRLFLLQVFHTRHKLP